MGHQPLPWTCSDCATRHDTLEQVAKCVLDRRRLNRLVLICSVIVIVVVLGLALAWNAYAYGDWKCLFIECRKVVL